MNKKNFIRFFFLLTLIESCKPSLKPEKDLRKFQTAEEEVTKALTPKENKNISDSNIVIENETNTLLEEIETSDQEQIESYNTYYFDKDGDGYGDINTPLQDVNQPSGYVIDSTDCNDNDNDIYPEAEEFCGDTKDKNCDGFTPLLLYPDEDQDDYGDSNGITIAADTTTCIYTDYSLTPGDCDDTDPNLTPNTEWYQDYDQDGSGAGVPIYVQCKNPSTSVITLSSNDKDCDDKNADMYDSNTGCVLEGDENDTNYTTYYYDSDDDGYGDPNTSQRTISEPNDYVENKDDCDDSNSFINPDGIETCGETVDKNCDGFLYDTLYPDQDEDGYGDPDANSIAATTTNCLLSKYSNLNTDCNDTDRNKNPDTKWYEDYDDDGYGKSSGNIIHIQCEEPVSSILQFANNKDDCNDDDKDTHPDENGDCVKIEQNKTYYYDADGDGYGDSDQTQETNLQPANYVTNDKDCDDSNIFINPEVIEICGETTDKNCDGFLYNTLYPDQDEDGYGDPDANSIAATTTNCLLSKYSNLNTDCDDTDPNKNPDTKWYEDYDDDGYGKSSGNVIYTQCEEPVSSILQFTNNKEDCNDDDKDTHPDENGTCVNTTQNKTYYYDSDGDGYGDPEKTKEANLQPADYVANDKDCDDTDNKVYPGAPETCGDTTDKDCDGFAPNKLYPDFDEDGYGNPDGNTIEANTANCLLARYSSSPTDCDDTDSDLTPNTNWYEDYDEDGYGRSSGNAIYTQCEKPSSSVVELVRTTTDCNDNDPNIHPGAAPGCFVDADCDGSEETSHCTVSETKIVSETNQSSTEGSLATISCDENWIMTGCTCYENNEGCKRGSFMKKESDSSITCNAYNATNNAVTVSAKCLHIGPSENTSRFMTNYALSIDTSSISTTADDNSTTISCNSAYTMTGCSCYSEGNSCGDGAYITSENSCLAKADGDGYGVYAIATCLRLDGEYSLTASNKKGTESESSDNASSTAQCSENYFATGCSCYTAYGLCDDGAKFSSNNSCVAYRDYQANTGHSDKTVAAYARCLKVE